MTEERRKLAEENIQLAYYMAWKFERDMQRHEEVEAICLLALVKAADCFDSKLGYAFATYATTVMRNDVLQYYQREERYRSLISLDIPIQGTDECSEMPREIPVTEQGFALAETRAVVGKNLRHEKLSKKERQLFEYVSMNPDRTQVEIAKAIKCEQSYVSRLKKRIRKKLYA